MRELLEKLARFLRREGYSVYSSCEDGGTWRIRVVGAGNSIDILARQQGELFALDVAPTKPNTGMEAGGGHRNG